MKYRKKRVVIEAYQTDIEMDIETLEGVMHADIGDYIITGVKGEQYPCKPDIFEQTYEIAEQTEPKAKNIASACINCSNHPSNGGSGICHCTLGTPKIK